MRYIELNPVRAKMVSHPVDYLWSSYSANADGKENPLVKLYDLYCQLGRSSLERRTAYRRFFRFAVCDTDLEENKKTGFQC